MNNRLSLRYMIHTEPNLDHDNDDLSFHEFNRKNHFLISMNTENIQNKINSTLKPRLTNATMTNANTATGFFNNMHNRDYNNQLKRNNKEMHVLDYFYPPYRANSHQSNQDHFLNKDQEHHENKLLFQPSLRRKVMKKHRISKILKSNENLLELNSQTNESLNQQLSFNSGIKNSRSNTGSKKKRAQSSLGHIQKKPDTIINSNNNNNNNPNHNHNPNNSTNILHLYERHGIATKKNYLENHEIEIYEKLAMKGGHHLLRTTFQIQHEENEKKKIFDDAYANSFERIHSGLRILRDKKCSKGIFDQSGNYVPVFSQESKPNIDLDALKTKAYDTDTTNQVIDSKAFSPGKIHIDKEEKNKNKFTLKSKDLKNILLEKDILKWKKHHTPHSNSKTHNRLNTTFTSNKSFHLHYKLLDSNDWQNRSFNFQSRILKINDSSNATTSGGTGHITSTSAGHITNTSTGHVTNTNGGNNDFDKTKSTWKTSSSFAKYKTAGEETLERPVFNSTKLIRQILMKNQKLPNKKIPQQ